METPVCALLKVSDPAGMGGGAGTVVSMVLVLGLINGSLK